MSRNAAQSLLSVPARRSLRPRGLALGDRPARRGDLARRHLPSATIAITHQRHHHHISVRQKSSVPFLSATSNPAQDEIHDRASANAAAFDAKYNLTEKDTLFSSWRTRQMEVTKRNPMRPFPKQPPNLIPPSPEYADSFFPSYAHTGRPGPPSMPPDHVLIHDEASADKMRKAARLARKLLDYVCHPSIAKAGRTTEEIDRLLHQAVLDRGAYPSPLNYHAFPKSVCSSINEVVCHGIPDSRPLERGDVVSFDVSCYIGGVHGDNCATAVVGDVDEGYEEEFSWDDKPTVSDGSQSDRDWPSTPIPEKTMFASPEEEERFVTARRLVQAALESRDEGVAACKPGGCLSDIGGAIHAVCDAYGYDTVRHYRGHGISSDFHCAPFVKVSFASLFAKNAVSGHGIGADFHRAPWVKHFRNSDTMELLPGMIFTIEPMLTEGTADCTEWEDNWTVATKDGGRAAQFEHTVLITETGVEVLTLP